MDEELLDVLGRFMQKSQYSAGQLAALSGIPRRTILNWLSGRVSKPHQWQSVVKVAAALRLDEVDTNQLLASAGHEAIDVLRQKAMSKAERELLSIWPDTTDSPFQAIADLPYFVGREAIIQELRELLQKGQYVTICSLKGMGGVGKTALAAHLAYLLRPLFPHGVLWARLDTSDTMAILSALASVYGHDVSSHRDITSRSMAVRNILADKQALVILDNAESSKQVRPLLPPTTGKTAVIVTTRQDLAISDEMHRFVIEPFSAEAEESLAVFTHFLGKATVERWDYELKAIADLLEHLPLAVAIAAGRLAMQISIPDYFAQLQMSDQRLNALIREDRSVRLSFDLSYQALAPHQQQFFAALGSFGGDDFGLSAAAQVTQTKKQETATLLQYLLDLSLVQPTHSERFRLHALLRDYAQEQQLDDKAAVQMVSYFATYAQQHRRDMEAIRLEISNILAALREAERVKLPERFIQGVIHTFPYWYTQGESFSAVLYLEKAMENAVAIKDTHSQSLALSSLATLYWSLGEASAAEVKAEESFTLAKQIGDIELICRNALNLSTYAAVSHGDYERAEEYLLEAQVYVQQLENPYLHASLLDNMANIAYEQWDWDKAESYFLRGTALIDQLQGLEKQAGTHFLHNLGVLYQERGKSEDARDFLEQALALAQELSHAELISLILCQLARSEYLEGNYAKAGQRLAKATKIAREIQHIEAVIRTNYHMGILAMYENKVNEALDYLTQALTLAQKAQIPWNEIDALLQIGELYLQQSDWQQAKRYFEQAFQQAQPLNLQGQMAEARYGLARTTLELGHISEAIQLAYESLTFFERIKHYRLHDIKQWLEQVN